MSKKGFSLIELLVVIAIIGILSSIAIGIMGKYRIQASYARVLSECKQLYNGFTAYYLAYDLYPNATSAPSFNLATFEPLRSEGYYTGHMKKWLVNGQADAYNSPDDRGLNQEFWVRMTLKSDTEVTFIVARSDNAPLSGGAWLEGVYAFRNGTKIFPD